MCPKNLKNGLYKYTLQSLIRYPGLKSLPRGKADVNKVWIQNKLIVIKYCGLNNSIAFMYR